jgi:hypothetical protein
MSYLIGTLKGDAANVVKGLKVTDANYPVAVDLIRKRFDDKQTIVAAHMTKVMNLVEGSKPCQDVSSLGRLFDQVNIQIRALEALKVDTTGMATTLITAFQRKAARISNPVAARTNSIGRLGGNERLHHQ